MSMTVLIWDRREKRYIRHEGVTHVFSDPYSIRVYAPPAAEADALPRIATSPALEPSTQPECRLCATYQNDEPHSRYLLEGCTSLGGGCV